MSVSSFVTLPAQPASGQSKFIPLGGDGSTSPLGCYLVELDLAGDAGGGTHLNGIIGDPRYTNLFAFGNAKVTSAAAAPDFLITLSDFSSGTQNQEPEISVVGSMPQTATGAPNATFLWYPPPIYYQGVGVMQFIGPNVDVTETYTLYCEVYCFDINVKRLYPLNLLQLVVPGVSAPASV